MRRLQRQGHPNLKPLYERTAALIGQFEHLEISHVPREKNAEADVLAKGPIKARRGARKI